MNDYFSLSRFGKLLNIHSRTHLIPIGIAAAIVLAFFVALNLLVTRVPDGYAGKFVGIGIVFVIMTGVIPFVTSIMAAHSFRDYNRRSTATRMLMLPCSKLEQYTSLYIIYIIFIPFIFACGALFIENLFLSSLVNDAFKELAGTPEFEAIANSMNGPVSLEDVRNGKLMSASSYFSTWLWLAAYQSLFFLGSTIFKKVPFILTNVCCFVLFIIFVVLAINVDPIGDALEEMGNIMSPESHAPSFVIPLVFLVLMTAASWLKFWKSKLV